MSEPNYPAPPSWLAVASGITRRLPAARYRAASFINRIAGIQPPFLATCVTDAGSFAWECDLRDAVARDVFFTGGYEPQETLLLQAILRRGDVCVDVGANWGYFTLLSGLAVGPGGRVVALEPDARLFPVLERNTTRNPATRYSLVRAAAYRANEPISLAGFDPAHGNFGTSRIAHAPESPGTTVEGRRLDDLLGGLDLGDIRLLKMDIEGAEGFALEGLASTLRRKQIAYVLLELHPAMLADHGLSASDACQPLLEAGYHAWRIDHSPATTRVAAYGGTGAGALLGPVDFARLDGFPHILWTRHDGDPLRDAPA